MTDGSIPSYNDAAQYVRDYFARDDYNATISGTRVVRDTDGSAIARSILVDGSSIGMGAIDVWFDVWFENGALYGEY